jgi:hypothetical protein
MDSNEQISGNTDVPVSAGTTSPAPRRSKSPSKRDTVTTARDRLKSAISAAEEQLDKIREWVAEHDASNANPPSTQATTLTNQLSTRLDKVSEAHSSLTRIRQKAATTTLASAVSVIDPNIDLGEIDDLIKSGASSDQVAKALADKLTGSSAHG